VYSLLTSSQLDEGASHVPLPCVLAEKLRSSRGLMQMNTHDCFFIRVHSRLTPFLELQTMQFVARGFHAIYSRSPITDEALRNNVLYRPMAGPTI